MKMLEQYLRDVEFQTSQIRLACQDDLQKEPTQVYQAEFELITALLAAIAEKSVYGSIVIGGRGK